MPEVINEVRAFRATHAWGAREIATIEGATVRLHWTDRPYVWHVNDGSEVFVVLDGLVDMRFRDCAGERLVRLTAGDMFVAGPGDEHVAEPSGEARVLVIEKSGSI